jgi:hypothetical protein
MFFLTIYFSRRAKTHYLKSLAKCPGRRTCKMFPIIKGKSVKQQKDLKQLLVSEASIFQYQRLQPSAATIPGVHVQKTFPTTDPGPAAQTGQEEGEDHLGDGQAVAALRVARC